MHNHTIRSHTASKEHKIIKVIFINYTSEMINNKRSDLAYNTKKDYHKSNKLSRKPDKYRM